MEYKERSEEQRNHEVKLAKACQPYTWAQAAGTFFRAAATIVFWICVFQHCSGGKILPW